MKSYKDKKWKSKGNKKTPTKEETKAKLELQNHIKKWDFPISNILK